MPSNTDMPSTITVRSVDYGNAREARALVELLDGYARDVAGGGVPLSAEVQRGLPEALRQRPQAFARAGEIGNAGPYADERQTPGEVHDHRSALVGLVQERLEDEHPRTVERPA